MTERIWNDFNQQLLGFVKTKVADTNTAEDILQEVFIKIHQKVGTVKDDSKITSWIYQITRNAIIDFYRKKKEFVSELPFEKTLPEELDYQESEFTNCIKPFLNQLPEKDRDVLNKIYFGKVSQKEYAEQYNQSYSAVKSRVQRAREKLKESFISCCNVQSDVYGNITDYSKEKCKKC